MTFYIIRRLGIGILLLLFMSVIFFALTRLTPGPPLTAGENPRANQELIDRRLHALGLDRPWYEQYPAYLVALSHGSLGNAYVVAKEPVTQLLAERVPNSILLLGVSLLVSLGIAIPLGVLAATRQYSLLDHLTSVISYTGVSVPSFVLGIFLLLLGGAYLHSWTGGAFSFPFVGMHSSDDKSLPDLLMHMVLPVTSLSILSIAGFSRFMRSSMLEVLHQDYIRTAKAKGLSARRVNYKHAMRNAILPIVTLVALQIPQFVSGAIITEGIFSWPGMGDLAFEATKVRDYPVILGVVMLVAVLTVLFNLLADVAYAVVDPRIRY